MSATVLWVLIAAAAAILAVLLYNTYQEAEYRKKIRAQFGHADRDALMEDTAAEVRDGASGSLFARKKAAHSPENAGGKDAIETPLPGAEFAEKSILSGGSSGDSGYRFAEVDLPPAESAAAGSRPAVKLKDLQKLELPWFNPCFDYMAYLVLRAPRELTAMPRLSGRHCTIAGCTRDERFQIAEPIPGVEYIAFVIGLQAISRDGLVRIEELDAFGEKVAAFAAQTDADFLLTDVGDFLNAARPLDELCTRVDQIIAIHLVSRGKISGKELAAALTAEGFHLGHDGAFHYPDTEKTLFNAVTLDQTPFTRSLLETQDYNGFSMIFSITQIPPGDKVFNRFMDLTVRLSGTLGLDLVNDELKELSPQWLRELGEYVAERQNEMQYVGIDPGSALAKRLFS